MEVLYNSTERGFILPIIILDAISNAKKRFFQVFLYEREARAACEQGLILSNFPTEISNVKCYLGKLFSHCCMKLRLGPHHVIILQ